MRNCLWCGAQVKSGHFCKSSGHHILYKNQLLRELANGTITQEHVDHLNFFHWMPEMQVVSGSETLDLPFPVDFDGDVDGDVVPVVKTKRTRKPRVKKEIGKDVQFRKFGVELECVCPMGNNEQIVQEIRNQGMQMQNTGYTHEDVAYWKSLYDGSVHGDYGYESKEFVSPPFATESGLDEVAKVCKVIVDHGGLTNQTTGTHIHLDASDLSPQEIAKVVYLYGALESKIDKLFPDDRRNGHYCKSVKRFCRYVAKSGFEYFDNIRRLSRVLGTRYLKVNVEAYLRHGTLEFRQMDGTLDSDKIKFWVKMCTRMIAFVKEGNDVRKVSGHANIFKLLGCKEDEIKFWTEKMAA